MLIVRMRNHSNEVKGISNKVKGINPIPNGDFLLGVASDG
jgi:hypothetical protein